MSEGQEKHIPDSGGDRVHPRLASLLEARKHCPACSTPYRYPR